MTYLKTVFYAIVAGIAIFIPISAAADNSFPDGCGKYLALVIDWTHPPDSIVQEIIPTKDEITYVQSAIREGTPILSCGELLSADVDGDRSVTEHDVEYLMALAKGQIEYADLPAYQRMPGDLDFDNKVTEREAFELLTDPAAYQDHPNGDVNGDGKVNADDAKQLRDCIMGKIGRIGSINTDA